MRFVASERVQSDKLYKKKIFFLIRPFYVHKNDPLSSIFFISSGVKSFFK